jgi:hypothetical protein
MVSKKKIYFSSPVRPSNAPCHHLHWPVLECGLHAQARHRLPLLVSYTPRLLPFQPLRFVQPSSTSPLDLPAPACGLHTQVMMPSSVASCLRHSLYLVVIGICFVFLFYFVFFFLLWSIWILLFYPMMKICFLSFCFDCSNASPP